MSTSTLPGRGIDVVEKQMEMSLAGIVGWKVEREDYDLMKLKA